VAVRSTLAKNSCTAGDTHHIAAREGARGGAGSGVARQAGRQAGRQMLAYDPTVQQ
jgi:hypothetical protein